jgi:hypothetical protein
LVRSDLEPSGAALRTLFRDNLAVDPDDVGVVLDLAAIGITNGAWRNSPVERWHGEGRIDDGGMLRANVATTKLVRQVLGEVLLDDVVAGELVDVDQVADADMGLVDELFVALFEALADPDRVLPDGRTLLELARENLDELVDHTDGALGAVVAIAERDGLDVALLRAGLHGGLACAHWWGTPWWPDIVEEFLARLDDPQHRHWGDDGERYAQLPVPPPEVADRSVLGSTLLRAPEELSAAGARFCVAAGIGFLHEPVEAWRTAHRRTEQG